MLIVQGEKTQCALRRGEGTKELETWLVSAELSKKMVVQSSQPNCVAQDSQVWHLGRLRVQARQRTALAIWPRFLAALGRDREHLPGRLSSFLTTIPFHIIIYKLFTSLSRRQRKEGLRQSGLLAFAPEPCCSVKMASTLQRSFFRRDSNER